MAVCVPRFDLVGTFIVDNEVGERETEGWCSLEPVNYSMPAMDKRDSITFLTTSFSEESDTVSVFCRYDGNTPSLRVCKTNFEGSYSGEACSTFYSEEGCPLFYSLVSTAAEVAFFAKSYPTPTIQARGYFVAAKTSSLLKIVMVDREFAILPPGVGEFYHRSQIRHSCLSEEKCTAIEPGILFIYVTTEKPKGFKVPQGSDVKVEVNGETFTVPSALVKNVGIMYPHDASSDLPSHMKLLLQYIHMMDKYKRTEDVHNKHYMGSLDESSVDQIIDTLVAAVDLLKPGIVRRMLDLLGEKIDATGGIQTLNDYGALMGFIMKV